MVKLVNSQRKILAMMEWTVHLAVKPLWETKKGNVNRKRCGEEELIHHFSSMSEAVTELGKDMKKDEKDNNVEEVDEHVKKIVSEDLRDTQELLAEQYGMIKGISSLMRPNGGK